MYDLDMAKIDLGVIISNPTPFPCPCGCGLTKEELRYQDWCVELRHQDAYVDYELRCMYNNDMVEQRRHAREKRKRKQDHRRYLEQCDMSREDERVRVLARHIERERIRREAMENDYIDERELEDMIE